LINSLITGKLGAVAIFSLVPLIEEMLKTGFALLFNSSVLYTHLTFGLVEAVFDVLRPGHNQAPAGVVGIISHGLYGWLTYKVLTLSGSVWLAMASAVALHSLWNAGVIFLAPAKRK
jgi:hypothetical protein